MTTFTYQTIGSFGTGNTGLVGTIGYSVTDAGGTTRIAFTTTGVSEATDSNSTANTGAYIARPTLNTAWAFPLIIEWKGPNGLYAPDVVLGDRAALTADGYDSTLSTNIGTTNTRVALSLPAVAPGANGGLATGNASNQVKIDLTQAVPTTNTAHTVGDALNAARADGFGKWVLSGTTLNMYASDGTTLVHSFTINDANTPTQRI